jgi:predicted O-methyltransferase YrrM
MDKLKMLAHLAEDKPLFHYADEHDVRRAALAGITLPLGDFSMAVSPGVLRWIADRVTDDMVTIETGAGKTTVLFAVLAKHHYCCTPSQREADKIRAYLERIGVSDDKVTFVIGSTDETLPRLGIGTIIDFAYIDGCHGYPFPALDWHYIDKHLRVGGIVGMDNAELRPVREHCEFLEENGAYRLTGTVFEWYFIRFYEKLLDQNREWIDQPYSRAKKDPCDWRLLTRVKRKASKWIKPYLY